MRIKHFMKFFLLFIALFFCHSFSVYAENNFEVTNIKVVENSGDMQIEDLAYQDNTITSSITFNTINDFITLEFEVKNNTQYDYQLLSISNNFEGEYLFINQSSVGEVVKAGDLHSYRVRIQYDNELLNQNLTLNSSNISLYFSKVLDITNPKTSMSMYTFILLVILLAVICFTIFYKKGKKKFLILLLCLIPTFVIAEESESITISFDNVSINGRFLEYDIRVMNGNTVLDSYKKRYGETINNLPSAESRNGYTFDGWFDQNNQLVQNGQMVVGELNIRTKYTPISYSITYDLDDGVLSEENPSTYTVEDQFTLHNPTKAGYSFSGWREGESSDLQTSVTIYSGTTGNKTYTAVFSADEDTGYTVIHRQMNMSGVYEEFERETLTGTTDTNVTPQRKSYTGFTAPSAQTKKINGNGSTTFTYDYSRNQYAFSITDRSEMNSNTTPNGTYYYGTTITISAKEKEGYTLLWSDDSNEYERSFTLSDETILTPTYEANTNTRYTVIHQKRDLNGTTFSAANTETEYFTGETDTKVTPSLNNYYGFTPISTAQEITITGDGEASVTYQYERNKYTLTLEDSQYIGTSTPSGEYYYETLITLTAIEREGFEFSKWSDNHVSNPYTFTLTGDLTISPQYTSIEFVPLEVCANNANITTLSSTKCTNNENVTIGSGIVCKRAIQLHQETCSQTSTSYFCSAAGYTINGSKGTNIITYGNCGTSGTLTSGDAFTCDVNGDGVFDELKERFYYVSDYFNTTTKSFDSTTAVLIYYNNVTGGISCNKNTYMYNSSNNIWHGPRTVMTQLPTTTQWSNVSLKNTSRVILAESGTTHNATSTSGGTLPTAYSYDGYAARFLTAQELMSGCGLTQVGNYTIGELDSCHYLMENTKYSKASPGSYGHWLETPHATFSNNVWIVYSYRRHVYHYGTYDNDDCGARPTIEVSKNAIEFGATRYNVSFNTDGGSSVSSQSVVSGLYATRPSDPTKSGYNFVNWYADSNYNTVFDFDNTPITNNKTIYAKFDLSPLLSADNENVTTLSSTKCTNNENVTIGNVIVCKRAIQLHQETCSQTSDHCYEAGYTTNGSKETNIITYGNCGTNGTLTSGDAFTCDVNGDGTFDELTERFYYVSDYFDTNTLEFDSSTAVLVYYNNVTSGVSCNKNTYAYDSSDYNYYGPRTLMTQLPTTTQWSNVSLKNTSRAILAEKTNTHNATSINGRTLPTAYSYAGYAARFLTAQELMSGCGLTQVRNRTTGDLDSCHYLMENTKYSKSSLGSYGHWLETPHASISNYVWSVLGNYRVVFDDLAFHSGFNGARPTIEVDKTNISY